MLSILLLKIGLSQKVIRYASVMRGLDGFTVEKGRSQDEQRAYRGSQTCRKAIRIAKELLRVRWPSSTAKLFDFWFTWDPFVQLQFVNREDASGRQRNGCSASIQ
jgi:hypothetical protein